MPLISLGDVFRQLGRFAMNSTRANNGSFSRVSGRRFDREDRDYADARADLGRDAFARRQKGSWS